MGKLQPTRLPKYFFNSKQHTAQPTPRLQETARHIYNTKPRNKQPVIQYHITNQKPAIRYETPRLQEKACHTIRNNETTVLQHLNFSFTYSAKPLASNTQPVMQCKTPRLQEKVCHTIRNSETAELQHTLPQILVQLVSVVDLLPPALRGG